MNMEITNKADFAGVDLRIRVTKRRFKAGAELPTSVNLTVDLTESGSETESGCSVELRIREGQGTERC
jgi:hypothetical protein